MAGRGRATVVATALVLVRRGPHTALRPTHIAAHHRAPAAPQKGNATDAIALGVEEEFLVVDGKSAALVPRADRVLPPARSLLGDEVASELNLCQIEIGTPVCHTLSEVRTELARLRRGLASAAGQAGCKVAAVGTHPFSMWQDQAVDARVERYRRMEDVYQIVARQQVICGCHVHVGIADPELAVATMNRVRPWISVLLALSANSPFWQGADTGYASYRLQVWQRWPTSGMPPTLSSLGELAELVGQLRAIEAIEDETFLYWYVRPSVRYPTLEFRACDVCPTVDDAVAVAGLVRGLAWTCARQALDGAPGQGTRPEVMNAAMWRAARYGLEGGLVSPAGMTTSPAHEVVAELLAFVRPGLEAHGDWAEVSELVAAIERRGTGASRQRASFARRQDPGDVMADALAATVPPAEVVVTP
jgi:carboxylate-amine ligase